MSRRVTLHPLTKFKPLMVKGCALADPVTGLGLTLLIDGAAACGAITLKLNWPDESAPGFITSTLQLCAAVVKIGLMTILLPAKELIGRFANVCPAVRSRRVTVHPLRNALPLMVNGCADAEPVTGFGATLDTDGTMSFPCTLNPNSPL